MNNYAVVAFESDGKCPVFDDDSELASCRNLSGNSLNLNRLKGLFTFADRHLPRPIAAVFYTDLAENVDDSRKQFRSLSY